jgi:hypothetical protein
MKQIYAKKCEKVLQGKAALNTLNGNPGCGCSIVWSASPIFGFLSIGFLQL